MKPETDPWPRYYRAEDIIRRLIRRQRAADERWTDTAINMNDRRAVCPITGGYRAAAPLYPAHEYLHAHRLLEPSPRAVHFSWVGAPGEKIINRVRRLLAPRNKK